MTLPTNRHLPAYSSFITMVKSKQHEGVLELGKAIVRQLNLDPGVDTLARWLAHDIAEKIRDFETCAPSQRTEKAAPCREAILQLWAHRHTLPRGLRPLESFEPIYATLKSLDISNNTPRYPQWQARLAGGNKSSGQTLWLELASSLDWSARLLIRHCLASAAHEAEQRLGEWRNIARDAAQPEDHDLRVVKELTDDDEIRSADTPIPIEAEHIQDLVERLKTFSELAAAMAEELRNTLPAVDVNADSDGPESVTE